MIVRQLRSLNGDVKEYTFLPKNRLVRECADLVTMKCEISNYVKQGKRLLDVILELHSPAFVKVCGEKRIPIRLYTDDLGRLLMECIYEMADEEFRGLLGLDENEWEGFKAGLYEDVAESCSAIGLDNANFRIRQYRVGGEVKKIRFRPISMISDYLFEIGIDLDLSHYIDLDNRPKKKGNKPIEQYIEEEVKKLQKKGLSPEEIDKEVYRLTVVPQYDIMLSLYYSRKRDPMALGMYTKPNGEVKFFNGDASNLYQQDLVRMLGIPDSQLSKFKESLCKEVLDVLQEVGIRYMSHTVDDLGLDEPWVDEIGQINMAAINRLKRSHPSKKKSKVVV